MKVRFPNMPTLLASSLKIRKKNRKSDERVGQPNQQQRDKSSSLSPRLWGRKNDRLQKNVKKKFRYSGNPYTIREKKIKVLYYEYHLRRIKGLWVIRLNLLSKLENVVQRPDAFCFVYLKHVAYYFKNEIKQRHLWLNYSTAARF